MGVGFTARKLAASYDTSIQDFEAQRRDREPTGAQGWWHPRDGESAGLAVAAGLYKIVDEGTPADVLELARLYKEAREAERKAQVARRAFASARDVSMRTLELRQQIIDTVAARGLDRTDRALDARVAEMRETADPQLKVALPQSLATTVTGDQLSDVGQSMDRARAEADKMSRVEIKFRPTTGSWR